MIPAIRTHRYLAPDTHTDFVPSPAPNRHTLLHRLRTSRPSTLQGSTICTSHLGTPTVTPSRASALSPCRDISELGAPNTPSQPSNPKLTHAEPRRDTASDGGQHRRSPGSEGPRGRGSSGWRGSLGRIGGQRAPWAQSRRAPAPLHPPTALAPARDSSTDMKLGPRTPKKPAPANHLRTLPSLRPPLAVLSTPGLADSLTDPPVGPLLP